MIGQPEEVNAVVETFVCDNVVGIFLDTYDPHALGGTGNLLLRDSLSCKI